MKSRLFFIGMFNVLLILAILSVGWSARAIGPETAVLPNTDPATVFLPLAVNRHDHTLGIPMFGVQMYGNTSDTSSFHPYLLESGASWLRVETSWNSVEPVDVDPAAYNWAAIDNILAAAREDMGGLNLIVTIEDAPGWAATEPDKPIFPAQLPEFVEYVAALVERFDGDGIDDAPGAPIILHWEFYNEPDADYRWGGNIIGESDGDLYAQMLAAVYPAVKAANPSAQVVLGGLAYDWFRDNSNGPFVREFLDDILLAGGGQYFDVMNFHYYPAFWPNWTTQGPGLFEKAEFIRNKLASYGLEKPTILTESGWHNNADPGLPSDDETQIRYVVELFTQSMAADLDVMVWWMLYDAGGVYPYDTGLVTNDVTPTEKLSFDVYKTMVTELSAAHFNRRLSNAETGNSDMEAYLFTDNVHQQEIYVAWLDPLDSTATASLKLAAPQVTVRSIVNGSTTVISDAADGKVDGKVTVTVSGRPVYIEISQ